MAVNIDNVYQQVLAVANKEQRGYITPQEFNLLARKAQLDIFEQLFYDYKTFVRIPGNNSKSADDLEMLRDKIAVHRVNEASVTLYAPNSWTISSHVHWLESVYDGQDYRTVDITFPAGSALDDNTDYVYLRAIYDGDGTYSAGENTYKVWFNLSTGDPSGDGVGAGVNDLWVTYLSDDSAAYIAQKFGNAINDQSPYHSATVANDKVSITYKQSGITGTDSTNITGATIDNISSEVDPVIYEEVNKDDWTYIKSSKKLNPSKASRGIFYRKSSGVLDIIPDPGKSIQCDYIKKPADPKWGYVVVNEKALYNSNTSTDFELHASEESTLTNKILELAGIIINKPGLSEVILRNEQMKEAKENR